MGSQTDVAADALPVKHSLDSFAANDMPYAIPANETLEAMPAHEMSKGIPNSFRRMSRTENIVRITRWSVETPEKRVRGYLYYVGKSERYRCRNYV